jgi:hypothetical protein
MTTDATAPNADRFYVAPTATQGQQLDNKRDQAWNGISDHLALLPKQPTVIATHVVDLSPLIAHFEKELQRLRDQLFVEKSAARSAREALVMAETRLKAAEGERERIRGDAYDERRGWQNRALNAENDRDAACDDRDNAVAELERERERFKRDVALASMSSPMLTPGSTAAVIEAYRLLVGNERSGAAMPSGMMSASTQARTLASAAPLFSSSDGSTSTRREVDHDRARDASAHRHAAAAAKVATGAAVRAGVGRGRADWQACDVWTAVAMAGAAGACGGGGVM